MERVGVHLADVGDLSSPALAKILKDTDCPTGSSTASSAFHRHHGQPYPAPSPAASAAASASGLSYTEETPTIGIDLSKSPTPGASLASILNGGPIEPGQVAAATRGRGRGRDDTAAAQAAAAAREAGLPPPPFLVGKPGSLGLTLPLGGGGGGGADSPAASGISSSVSGVSSGVSSVTPNRGMSPVTVGGRERSASPASLAGAASGALGRNGGNPSRSNSLAASPLGGSSGRNEGRLRRTNSLAASPLSTQPYANSGGGGAQAMRFGRSATVEIPAAAGDGLGDTDKFATASVEVSAGRGWISSPIDAKNVGKEDTSVVTPWDTSSSSGSGGASGRASGSGGASSYRPGDGLGFVGDGAAEYPAGPGVTTNTKRGRGTTSVGGGSAGTGGGGRTWEGGRRKSEPEPREQQQPDFDEDAFARQEQRMRHAYLQRLASQEESPAPSGRKRQGGGGLFDSLASASSSMREHSGDRPSTKPADAPSHSSR